MAKVPAYQLRRQTGRGDHWFIGKQILNAYSLDDRVSLRKPQALFEDIYLNTYDSMPTLPGPWGHLGLLKLPFSHRPDSASSAESSLRLGAR